MTGPWGSRSRRLRVLIPATSANLGPGFDALALALDLYNSLEVLAPARDGVTTVAVTGEGAGQLETGEDNLVVVAMRRLAASVGATLPSLEVHQTNAIPLGRGLGSSAAAIAGGLLAAAALLDLPQRPEALLPLALGLESHPDNLAAALWGGLTIGILVGDTALVRRIDPPQGLKAVLLVPDRFASTREARGLLPPTVSRADAIFNASRCALLVADLAAGRFDALAVAMQDRLHQPQRGQDFTYLQPAIQAALEAGAHGAALSGAGSSVIALATEHLESVAAALATVAATHALSARTIILQPARQGARVSALE